MAIDWGAPGGLYCGRSHRIMRAPSAMDSSFVIAPKYTKAGRPSTLSLILDKQYSTNDFGKSHPVHPLHFIGLLAGRTAAGFDFDFCVRFRLTSRASPKQPEERRRFGGMGLSGVLEMRCYVLWQFTISQSNKGDAITYLSFVVLFFEQAKSAHRHTDKNLDESCRITLQYHSHTILTDTAFHF